MLTPEQKEQNVLALRALMDGKPIEFSLGGELWSETDSASDIDKHPHRPKPEPVWSLPAPPEGMRWHREDFTDADLAGGKRPLLLGEKEEADDESWGGAGWENNSEVHTTTASLSFAEEWWTRHRTTRPLPTAPKLRAWNKPSDVPGPVCWLRKRDKTGKYASIEAMIVSVSDRGFEWFTHEGRFVTWDDSKISQLEYSTDRETWLPCTVLE